MKKLFALGLLVALASAVYALPTVLGTNGGFLVQNATIQEGVALSVTENFDGGSDIPLTSVTFGAMEALELGALYADFGGDDNWGVFAKFALPFTIANGKLAAGLTYFDNDGDNSWAGALSGTFPVFTDAQFTAEVLFANSDDDDQTSFLFNLEKGFENGTALGFEYYFNLAPISVLESGDDFGTAYITFPINEMLSARAALTGINESTSFVGTVTAKF